MSIGKMTVQDFCEKHGACADGKEWAIGTEAANMAELWKREDLRTDWRLWIFERSDVDKQTAVRFAVFCARQNWNLLTDQRSKDVIETAERWLDGNATMTELEEAMAAAEAAEARAAASSTALVARSTNWEVWAARSATAAADASLMAVRYASRATAAARASVRAAWVSGEAQNDWLIKNVEI